jgi:hypothetical protein
MSFVLVLVMVRDRDTVVHNADFMVDHRDITMADPHGIVAGHHGRIHDSVGWISLADLDDS